jgi:hypothetical protein
MRWPTSASLPALLNSSRTSETTARSSCAFGLIAASLSIGHLRGRRAHHRRRQLRRLDDLADVGDGDLAFLQGYYAKALGDPAKSRYRESNQDGLDAVNAEIAFREGGDREPGAD